MQDKGSCCGAGINVELPERYDAVVAALPVTAMWLLRQGNLPRFCINQYPGGRLAWAAMLDSDHDCGNIIIIVHDDDDDDDDVDPIS